MKQFVDENNYPLFDGLVGLKQKPMKTAVEWFMDKISEKQPNGLYVIDTLEDVQNVFEQAKEKEKEQIMYSYTNGSQDMALEDKYEPLEYYNQTYNQNK
jgi:hypothetical protein